MSKTKRVIWVLYLVGFAGLLIWDAAVKWGTVSWIQTGIFLSLAGLCLTFAVGIASGLRLVFDRRQALWR